MSWANDLRAALPAWLIGLILVSLGFLPYADSAGVLGYTLGCCAIGAILAGYDFTHRTEWLTLTQPVERETIWRRRIILAAIGCVSIAALALLQPRTTSFFTPVYEVGLRGLIIFAAPLLTGLCVVPLVTLLSRSPLAGAVLSVPLPFGIAWLSELVADLRYGAAASLEPGHQQLRASLGCLLVVVSAVACFILAKRRFLLLEVIESSGAFAPHAPLPAADEAISDSSPRRRIHPLAALAAKELRLQTLALLPAVLLAATLLHWQFRIEPSPMHGLLCMFWAFLTVVLLGATGSAEERQLGLTQAQALLPISQWKQWAVKVGLLFLFAFIAVELAPALLLYFGPWKYPLHDLARAIAWTTPATVALLVLSLYCSSLTRASLPAILLALPCCALLLVLLLTPIFWAGQSLAYESLVGPRQFIHVVPWLLLGAAVAVLLVAAMRNHFAMHVSVWKVLAQIKNSILASLVTFLLLLVAAWIF
jgi:hypothetical protein